MQGGTCPALVAFGCEHLPGAVEYRDRGIVVPVLAPPPPCGEERQCGLLAAETVRGVDQLPIGGSRLLIAPVLAADGSPLGGHRQRRGPVLAGGVRPMSSAQLFDRPPDMPLRLLRAGEFHQH